MDRKPGSRPQRPSLLAAVARPIQLFFRLEAASGLLLIGAAAIALAWANSPHAASYRAAVHFPIIVGTGGWSVRLTVLELVNDGLMTLFFFLVGMEIKRELVAGELKTLSRATLPAIAALGGMIVPAALYLAFNLGGPGERGWGVPMATDIAFCVGCLTLLRRRVPHGLLVFVTALAIFDDIGGVLVIALFYGHGLDAAWLAAAGGITLALVAANRLGARSASWYLAGGAALWWALHGAGIHATLSGVIVGLIVPAGPPGELDTPLARLIHALHPWVAFGIMPLFALANSGVSLEAVSASDVASPVPLGIIAGLFVGKQAGIFLFTAAAVWLGLAERPGGASMAKIYGASVIAGIGFTVALFIASLAFAGDARALDLAKLGILVGSIASALVGSLILRLTALHPGPRRS